MTITITITVKNATTIITGKPCMRMRKENTLL
jgi:hypothetical protein